MGSASPPPTPRPPAARPATGDEGVPQASTASRYHFADRKVSMGPSGTSILLVIAAVGIGLWFYYKPPGDISSQALQRYAGFESNMETVVLSNCTPPGCAAIYLTPTMGTGFQQTLPAAVAVADQLEQQGIECFIVFGKEPVKDAVKRARGVRRPVVIDPNGDWARESGIEKSPYWIAWRTGGKIRLRSEEPVSAAEIASAIR